MNYTELDFIFPFVVFGYGAVMTLILASPFMLELAEKRLPPETVARFKGTKILGLICFVVGGLWSLQNMWLK